MITSYHSSRSNATLFCLPFGCMQVQISKIHFNMNRIVASEKPKKIYFNFNKQRYIFVQICSGVLLFFLIDDVERHLWDCLVWPSTNLHVLGPSTNRSVKVLVFPGLSRRQNYFCMSWTVNWYIYCIQSLYSLCIEEVFIVVYYWSLLCDVGWLLCVVCL